MKSEDHIRVTEEFSAHNYKPVHVVIAEGQGSWVTDVEGKRYLDCLTAYSAVSFGHSNPRLIAAAKRQLDRITLTSRAFYNDQLGLFCKELAELCAMECVLPMNTGAEGVETAIKLSRKWGYEIKGIPEGKAEVIVFAENFHGRTTTIVGFSSSVLSRSGFGPFSPGFIMVPYGDIKSLEVAINPNTAAVLIEPIQGEAGVIIPPDGFLLRVRELCNRNNVLMVADEVQTGLCRTGEIFACEHERVKPDVYILGKALGGGIMPLSAVVSSRSVMQVFSPGSHGSTFGGNPLATAIGREVIGLIKEDQPHLQARKTGARLMKALEGMKGKVISAVRGRGLLIGIDITDRNGKARKYCDALKDAGLLCKDTHDKTLRIAPPLTISHSEVDWVIKQLEAVFC